MSMFHYIAANKELATGNFGGRKKNSDKKTKMIAFTQIESKGIPLDQIIDISKLDIKDDEKEIYKNFEDAAGIYIHDINPQNTEIKKQFKGKFVYELSPSFGDFSLSPDLKEEDIDRYNANRKCINELFEYVKRYIDREEEVEIYTCWADEEGEERKRELDIIIDLKTFNIDDFVKLQERQYVVIRT